MKSLIGMAIAALVATLLAGCATEPTDPTIVSSTRSRECKVTSVHSARDSLYYDIHRKDPRDDGVAQAEGTAGLGRAQQPGRTPPSLREPAGIGNLELAMRDC